MKVLVALDNSPYVEQVIEAIATRQWAHHTEFILIHVVDETAVRNFAQSVTDAEQARTSAHMHIANQLHCMRKSLPYNKISYEVVRGSVEDAILSAATRLDIDLIILGYQGLPEETGPGPLRVAQYVVENAPCSVEVVKPKRAASKRAGARGAIAV